MYFSPVVDKFCYLESILSSNVNINDDIAYRMAKASQSFGRLTKRLWDDHGISVNTKVEVYKAIILTSLFMERNPGFSTAVMYVNWNSFTWGVFENLIM